MKKDKICSKCKILKDINEFNKQQCTKDGFAYRCRCCANEYGIKYSKDHKEERDKKYQENKEDISKYNHQQKLTVINHYTQGNNTCMWDEGCSINDSDMLLVDHINDDGAEHRKLVGSGSKMYKWIIKHNFPEGFQILCHNHNYKKELLKRRKLKND